MTAGNPSGGGKCASICHQHSLTHSLNSWSITGGQRGGKGARLDAAARFIPTPEPVLSTYNATAPIADGHVHAEATAVCRQTATYIWCRNGDMVLQIRNPTGRWEAENRGLELFRCIVTGFRVKNKHGSGEVAGFLKGGGCTASHSNSILQLKIPRNQVLPCIFHW